MITDLGLTEYNKFMNQYLQFYVDDLSPILTKVSENGYTQYFARLSSTYDVAASTGELNVAHLVLYHNDSAMFFDIVAPVSSLSNDELTDFSFEEWNSTECAGAHQLKWELSEYSALVALSKTNEGNQIWEDSTGLTTPLFIGMGVPVSWFSTVNDIFTMVGTVTNMTEKVVVYNSNCWYREMVIDAPWGDDTTNVSSTVVRYIVQTYANDGPTDYTLDDWETLHETIYDEQQTLKDAEEATWSRYLDSHIGLQSPETETCSTSRKLISSAYEAIDNEYLYTKRGHVRYYTGVEGIVSWVMRCADIIRVGDVRALISLPMVRPVLSPRSK
jgi:hypothetical protein